MSHSVSLWLALLPHLWLTSLGQGPRLFFLLFSSSTWNIYLLLANSWCLEYTWVNLGSLFCTVKRNAPTAPVPLLLPPTKSCFRNIWNVLKNSFFYCLLAWPMKHLVTLLPELHSFNQGERHLPRIEVPMNGKYVDHSTNYLLQSYIFMCVCILASLFQYLLARVISLSTVSSAPLLPSPPLSLVHRHPACIFFHPPGAVIMSLLAWTLYSSVSGQ